MNDSIYSFISNAVGPDGLLPEGFEPDEEDKEIIADISDLKKSYEGG